MTSLIPSGVRPGAGGKMTAPQTAPNVGDVLRVSSVDGQLENSDALTTIETLLDSNNAALDTLQEIVDFVENNRNDLDLLGSAANEDVGTAAGNVVQLDGSARLPAVDGSQLTGLPNLLGSDNTWTGANTFASDTTVSHTQNTYATSTVKHGAIGGFFRAYSNSFSVASLRNKASFGPDGADGIVVFSNATAASNSSGSISLRGGGYDTAAEKVFIDKDVVTIKDNVEQRNGANPQELQIYEQYTDASNRSHLSIRAQTGGDFVIAPVAVGATKRKLRIENLIAPDAMRVEQANNSALYTYYEDNRIFANHNTWSIFVSDALDGNKYIYWKSWNGSAYEMRLNGGDVPIHSESEFLFDGGIGLFGTTPVSTQPAAIADATDAATTQSALNSLLAAMRSYGFIDT